MLSISIHNNLFRPLGFSPLGFSSAKCNLWGSTSRDVKATNASNERMNEANNKLQMDLWHEQQEYDYKMWNEQNAYNDPSAQVERLKNAGINPALALSNISTGEASSSAGGQTPPTTNPSHYETGWQETQAKVQNLALVGQSFANLAKKRAETEQIQLENGWTNTKNALQVASLTKDNKLRDEAIYSATRLNQFNDRTFDARVQQEEDRAMLILRQGLGVGLDNSIKELQKDALKYSNDYLLPQQYQKNEAEIKKVLTDAVVEVYDAQTNRYKARTDRYNAYTNRLQYFENVRVDDETIKEINSRINNNDADTATKRFWNQLNNEEKRWIVTGMVSEARNKSLEPLWNSLNIGTKFIPLIP